jgi:hypothetical protein
MAIGTQTPGPYTAVSASCSHGPRFGPTPVGTVERMTPAVLNGVPSSEWRNASAWPSSWVRTDSYVVWLVMLWWISTSAATTSLNVSPRNTCVNGGPLK